MSVVEKKLEEVSVEEFCESIFEEYERGDRYDRGMKVMYLSMEYAALWHEIKGVDIANGLNVGFVPIKNDYPWVYYTKA